MKFLLPRRSTGKLSGRWWKGWERRRNLPTARRNRLAWRIARGGIGRGFFRASFPLRRLWLLFAMYALAGLNRTPDGAIGQADAMTGIQVKGAFGVDVSQVILVIGILAAAFAAVQTVRALRGSRRKA